MRFKPDVSGLIASLVIITITLCLFFAVRSSTLNTIRYETAIKLERVNSSLETSLGGCVQSLRTLSIVLASNPAIQRGDFDHIAIDLLRENPSIEKIILSRGETVTHVYPIKGNEKLIGSRTPSEVLYDNRNPALQTVFGKMMPFNTSADGNLVTTLPLFTSQAVNPERIYHWGSIEIVINRLKLLRSAGIEPENSDLRVAIKQKDVITGINRILYGSEIIFQSNPVVSTIDLPYGSWEVVAEPYDGWPIITSLSMIVLITGFALAIYCAYLLTRLEKMKITIKEMSYHDTLTGLPNRAFFNDRLSMAISHARRDKNKIAVFMIDLDRFKFVNDTYGHQVGDLMLQKIAQRLLKIVRETDSVIRQGDDEFTLILPGIKSKDDADIFEEKLLNAFKAPFLCGKLVLHVGINLGRAIFPDDGDNIDGLIKTADLSLFQAKNDR